jgi:gliding motility-associated-like protein
LTKNYLVTFSKILLFSLLFAFQLQAQNVSLYNQFNGRYDFLFVGNTMNVQENSANDPCLILTNSSANLNLNSGDTILKAYLYWAGSGSGDFQIKLNTADIVPTRTFTTTQTSSGNPFFSAFADVTSQVQNTGNAIYTVSDFDISSFLNANTYCNNGTNFAGWAMVIIYENLNLPLNQLNVYDGFQAIPISQQSPPETSLTINLNSLNVIDNIGAKIGFIAWEGDKNISVRESLFINSNLISALPLNPSNNVFNGTNSFTQNPNLYNMDLDVFDIQNTIQIGDSFANIVLSSGQDFVIMNAVVTKLNSQLPDATIVINSVNQQCFSRIIQVDYTVFNTNATNVLLSGTPIAIYANGIFIAYAETINPIPVGGSSSDTIFITIPFAIPENFILQMVVDDIGNGTGIRTELAENNNSFSVDFSFFDIPKFNNLQDIEACNEGFTNGTFDFGDYNQLVLQNNNTFAGYYETMMDAELEQNSILNSSNYIANTTPKEIFIRVENENCYAITSFFLKVINCKPTVYNYISANQDGSNDYFLIAGLRDIFLKFEIAIYNRWGKEIWKGNQNTEDWHGTSENGFLTNETPTGTYFYVIRLNDANFPNPLTGFIYLER